MFFFCSPIVLLADDPEMPAVKPAKNLVRSGQRGTTELSGGTANATVTSNGRHSGRNGTRTRKNKGERRKGAGRKHNKKGQETKRNKNGGGASAVASNPLNGGTGNNGKSGRRNQQKGNKENASNHSSHRRNNNNRDRKRKKGNINSKQSINLFAIQYNTILLTSR